MNPRGREKPIMKKFGIASKKEGCSYRSIRKQTGLALSTVRRIIIEQVVVIEI